MTATTNQSAVKPGEPYSPHRRFLCAPVPLALMKLPHLSAGAKLLFARLALHAGRETHCFPSLTCLADELGTSIDVISRWMRELIEGKFISRKRRGPGRNAECEFLWHPELAPGSARDDSDVSQNQDPAFSQNQEPVDSAESRNLEAAEMGGKTPQIHNQDSVFSRNAYKEQAVHINGSFKRNTESARVTAADLDQTSLRFEEAWEKWPGHKARKNRAAQMWVSVVTTSNERKVFACLERFRASDLVARGVVGYFDTWLQQQHADAWENSWLAPRQEQRSRQQEAVDAFRSA